MLPDQIAELNAIESAEIEGEIRLRHQPLPHAGAACPTGVCCSCGASGGCETGIVLVLLSEARAASTQEERGDGE